MSRSSRGVLSAGIAGKTVRRVRRQVVIASKTSRASRLAAFVRYRVRYAFGCSFGLLPLTASRLKRPVRSESNPHPALHFATCGVVRLFGWSIAPCPALIPLSRTFCGSLADKTAYTPVRPVHPENGQVRFRAFRVVPRHHWRAFLFPQMERNNDENTGFIAIWE